MAEMHPIPPCVQVRIERGSQLIRLDQGLDGVQRCPGTRPLGKLDHRLPRGMHQTSRGQFGDPRLVQSRPLALRLTRRE